MNKASTNDIKEAKTAEGKLKKILKSIKKALSKELLWILFIVLLSIPVTLILSYIIKHSSVDLGEVFSIITENCYPSFVVLYIICAIGLYFSRMVAIAIKIQLEAKKQ